ncbi:MAG TPA: rhodanese-like domain-containing protein [Planctomycetaceae bacterium]|nr:rhodanese-like domain-containing protein [Planctomycetaceae bacterium]
MTTTSTITPRRLSELRESGAPVELIDVRTPAEFGEVHVDFARNVPLDALDPASFPHNGNGHEPLYVICRTGNRAAKACEKLAAAGRPNVVNVEGGTQAWADAGLPVVRGRKAMSLERQVRIAAGTLVLIGVLLGWFVHPWFLALSAFVGAGLVFAGVTDTCGMAMLLARMPWNRRPACRTN